MEKSRRWKRVEEIIYLENFVALNNSLPKISSSMYIYSFFQEKINIFNRTKNLRFSASPSIVGNSDYKTDSVILAQILGNSWQKELFTKQSIISSISQKKF